MFKRYIKSFKTKSTERLQLSLEIDELGERVLVILH